MVTITHLLWLGINLLSHVNAQEEADYASGTVKWVQAGRSVLIHLPTPDLHFFLCIGIVRRLKNLVSDFHIEVILIRSVREGNQRDRIATHYPGAFIFNFTLTADNLTLLLNDEPILPRTHPHIPTPLRVHQTPESATCFANRVCTNFSTAPVMDLDYYISTPDPTSGTSIWNPKYNPRLQIDILRASFSSFPGYSTPLSSDAQQQIWVWLEDLSAHPPNTLYSTIPLRISDIKADSRWFWQNTKGGDNYKAPQDLKTCHIWSWLCADIPDYPHYEYIYQINFDQYGKKGSLRHFVTQTWAMLVELIGLQQAMALSALCVSIVLCLVVSLLLRAVKNVIGMYRMRMQEVDEWVADEELEDSIHEEEVRNDKVRAEKAREDKIRKNKVP
ncbi:hypothetical protein LTR84_008795 [Exophiala bonariae]|uniref:Uncharacterized protein n=1 Tax=Exophiala bonariae TaxID=1690606 RepID=A0AAV9MXK3_9EURO|nr:hypothetical protein LTR84_008795 [Exophiala bonariae]